MALKIFIVFFELVEHSTHNLTLWDFTRKFPEGKKSNIFLYFA